MRETPRPGTRLTATRTLLLLDGRSHYTPHRSLPRGTSLVVEGADGEWLALRPLTAHDNGRGWIHRDEWDPPPGRPPGVTEGWELSTQKPRKRD